MSIAPENATSIAPRWDRDGLITAVVTHMETGALLMVAHMNAAALNHTQDTGIAHFWSRSRQQLWRKGVTSGNELRVQEMRIDCDQDAIWLRVLPVGAACHTGADSCFYRVVGADGGLTRA